jgi:rSAM/selenodomain-associated transferase 1
LTIADTAVIVFAKAPLAGLAKTRLIPALGAAGAAALAERMLVHAVATAVSARLGPVELCVSPDAAHACFQQLAQRHGLQVVQQGEGDLGQRMHRALQRALQGQQQVLLMGADAPGLDAALLRQAAQALHSHDAVFVPALDGGYVLVGLKRPQAALFEGMTWSTAQVMQHSRDRARAAGLSWAETPPVADIDVPGDLQHVPAGWRAAAAPR